MEHLTDFSQLIGKTIKEICNPYKEDLMIKFEDNSFCFLISSTDYDSGYHMSFDLKKVLSPFEKVEVGLITLEQAQKEFRAENLIQAEHDLIQMKRDFPELFK